MIVRKPVRLSLEALEMRTMLSAGVSSAPAAAQAHVAAQRAAIVEAAHYGAPAESRASLIAARSGASLALSGSADGDYTSRQHGSSATTKYNLTAAGTITPVGQAVLTGSFKAPTSMRGGETAGTLKLVGFSGGLTLTLKVPRPIHASAAVTEGPIILVNDFAFTVTKGTGAYAGDHGTGTVEITTTPGFATPTGPGIYASRAVAASGVGRTTITFQTGPLPLF
jgi:hypothetical protein